jgi:hypothetical protein
MFGYADPSLFGSDFGFNINFSASIDEKELFTEEEWLWQHYETTDLNLRGGFTWNAARNLSLGAGAGYASRSVTNNFKSVFLPPDSARFFLSAVSLQYADLNYGSVLVYGFIFRAQYEYAHSLKTDINNYHQYEANLRYYRELWDGHRLGFTASGLHVEKAPLVMEREIGGRMFKTLPDGLTADAAVSGQAALEFILFRFPWGSLTAQAAYEAGVYSRRVLREHSDLVSGTDGTSWSHGPGMGLRVYLARVALPALGIDVYRNARTGKTYSSFYMGVSF